MSDHTSPAFPATSANINPIGHEPRATLIVEPFESQA
eukprot:CAMPEP_0172201696 /NCGR_PEP_ID=MMETSP1050-20130122/30173_1 /TAXON_ID=233186 /ORGANISM="Cryptomonas curvata, Strain CCAP979/52" /LENGTH=36 /DNA_ID= /DNA_START= /DNA_END= /DNA_ORIENTATION=